MALTVGGNNASTTFSGGLAGLGGLTMVGTGTLVLSASNAYTGSTTISSGTLQLGNGSSLGSVSTASTIIDNGVLAFSRSNTVTQGIDFSSTTITESGGLVQFGPGTLVLAASNGYTGGTMIAGGTLQAGNNARSGQTLRH